MQGKVITIRTRKVLLQLLLLICIFQLSRVLFFLINKTYFQDLGVYEYFLLSLHGIRYDLSAIFSINLPYLFLYLLPFPNLFSNTYLRLLNVLFIITNSISLAFEVSDIAYFPFVRKRMTGEVFYLLKKKSDFIDLLPSYLTEFWYVPIILLFSIGLLIYLNGRIKISKEILRSESWGIKNFISFILIMFFSIIFIRGGFQLKPILNTNALLITSHEYSPLVLNTTFSVLHTLEHKKPDKLSLISESAMLRSFNPIKNYYRGLAPRNCNVVVIMLESFGKQYTGIGGRTSYTPFLDSLMSDGKVCTHAFANGHRSADGVPACLAGIPALNDEAFTTSAFSENTIETLPLLLKSLGYRSSFFHGGTNGTMSFDIFAKSAGFDQYYGRSEYNHDQDYDGTWGIWDEPFLQYYSEKLDHEKEPFFSSMFTLSSHEPFKIPNQYAQSSIGKLDGIYRGISYTDMALQRFFETSSKKPWFQNTLFVITADHNFLGNQDSLGYYNQGIGLYSIPILFYHPSDKQLNGYHEGITQQIDILPSVLDYLQFPHHFFAYGHSIFDSITKPSVFMQMGAHYQFLIQDYIITGDRDDQCKMFDYKRDSLQRNSLNEHPLKDSLFRQYKAFKQLLQNTMVENKMTVKRFRYSLSEEKEVFR